jgi:colanic acid biosynthesis glycosyl transferase WcaI
MKIAVLCPHFEPDVAPTGVVMTRIVHELVELGHELHVVTALPWYQHHRVDDGWTGRITRVERTDWGSIRRVHPFPTDKRSIVKRAGAFAGFSTLAGLSGMRGGRVDAVLAMSPPLTLGLTGWAMSVARRAPLVFNIQDVFPDVAVELGAITNPSVIRVARTLERLSYRAADSVTVLSDDLAANVRAKIATGSSGKVRVIPNFVDTERIVPGSRDNAYRRELGLGDRTVVMYAGNVGMSQSLELMVDAARRMSNRSDVVFVINGSGSGRPALETAAAAAGLTNVVFGDFQPAERLADVLATGDIHVVPLKRGLAASSVPSKTYSILAAGRPLVASVDPGTEVARVTERADCGLAVPPEDPAAFCAAIAELVDEPARRADMGAAGRRFVEGWASAKAVARAYEELFEELRAR